MTVTPDPRAGAAGDVRDGLLRGLAHELSNRTGTIGAVAEALVAADPSSRLALALLAEAAPLDEVLRLLRLLPADPARPEASISKNSFDFIVLGLIKDQHKPLSATLTDCEREFSPGQ